MATKLIRYNGVNDPQQNIVEIDLSDIPNNSAFTIDILYSCRNLTNGTYEQTGIHRYINLYSKYSGGSYNLVYIRSIISFDLGSAVYTMISNIAGDTLYLDLVNPNTDTTVLFDCKLEY